MELEAPNVEAAVDIAPSSDSQSQPEAFDLGSQDYSAAFGLEPEKDAPSENGPATQDQEETPKDVPATDTPATHQATEDVTTGAEAPAEATTQTDDATKDAAFKDNEKLQWESAPKSFREEYKALRAEYERISDPAANWEQAYLTEQPQDFIKRLHETSPTTYQEIGTLIATESAKANPESWAQFLVEHHPDLVAKTLTGQDVTADRLKAERAVLDATDEAEVVAAMDKPKPDAAPAETLEQKQLKEFLKEREVQKQAEVQREVFGPVESAINTLVSDAGLEIKDEVWNADFNTLDEDTKFKVTVNSMIPVFIDQRIQADPKLRNMQARLQQFLEKGDVKSALNLQHQAKIAATNFVGEFLGLMTGYRAKSKQADLTPPAQTAPKVHVPTGGHATTPVAPPAPKADENMWKVTEADMTRRR